MLLEVLELIDVGVKLILLWRFKPGKMLFELIQAWPKQQGFVVALHHLDACSQHFQHPCVIAMILFTHIINVQSNWTNETVPIEFSFGLLLLNECLADVSHVFHQDGADVFGFWLPPRVHIINSIKWETTLVNNITEFLEGVF